MKGRPLKVRIVAACFFLVGLGMPKFWPLSGNRSNENAARTHSILECFFWVGSGLAPPSSSRPSAPGLRHDGPVRQHFARSRSAAPDAECREQAGPRTGALDRGAAIRTRAQAPEPHARGSALRSGGAAIAGAT